MLNLIPTPNFAEINETKTLNVQSIVINEADINRNVIDDLCVFEQNQYSKRQRLTD